jgi:nucleoside-diphosphate-sugar epimerase
MYLDNKLVLLAGATGLVGSSVMSHLLAHYPTTRIRAAYLHTPPLIQHKRVEYIHADLKSEPDCQRLAHGCDGAIMAAAASTGGAGLVTSAPWRQVNDTLIMNAQMLEAFFHENIRRVVYIGSITVYQEFEGYIKEGDLDLNQDPHQAYLGIGWVVRFAEKLCQFWQQQGMEILVARSANVFGPFAKFDPRFSNFIPAIIRKAVDRMDPFEVWGSPQVTRDVIYSEDFGRAIAMMMDNDQVTSGVFNIGSGVQTRVGDAVTWALKYARHSPREIKYLADRPTTNQFRALDCSRIKAVFGWQPNYTIEQGIEKTTEWWLENKDRWNK